MNPSPIPHPAQSLSNRRDMTTKSHGPAVPWEAASTSAGEGSFANYVYMTQCAKVTYCDCIIF